MEEKVMAARYGIFGSGTENWNKEDDLPIQIIWTHINNHHLRVVIRRNPDRTHPEKYRVSHLHPGPRGAVIIQPFEYVRTLAEAYKKAKVHLKHWNNPFKWASDPDFGKRG
jgi:hypothetical protein